jgi:hypothetical protein
VLWRSAPPGVSPAGGFSAPGLCSRDNRPASGPRPDAPTKSPRSWCANRLGFEPWPAQANLHTGSADNRNASARDAFVGEGWPAGIEPTPRGSQPRMQDRYTTATTLRELRGQESNLLSRAHEAREMPFLYRAAVMWPAGIEPATPCSSGKRSTGLSYSHVELHSRFSVPLSHPSALDQRAPSYVEGCWSRVPTRVPRRGLSLLGGASVSQ